VASPPCSFTNRIALNVALAEALRSGVASCGAAALRFRQVVPVEHFPDYLHFVKPADATLSLDTIASRARACFYTTVAEFGADVGQLLANAKAYNSTGTGRFADPAAIRDAEFVTEALERSLVANKPVLDAAESNMHGSIATRPTHRSASAAMQDPSNDVGSSCQDVVTSSCGVPTQPSSQARRQDSGLEALADACEIETDRPSHDKQVVDPPARVPASDPNLCAAPVEPQNLARDAGRSPDPGCTLDTTSLRPAARAPATSAQALLSPASTAAAAKFRRHKSKVYIRLNKVVYLPTTFMEEYFDPASLPMNINMIVEANGVELPDTHTVTIKAVPRTGLSTMYCMTNVLTFQQRFLNWQILDWTKVDAARIKIHLSGPHPEPKPAAAAAAVQLPAAAQASNKRKGDCHAAVAPDEAFNQPQERSCVWLGDGRVLQLDSKRHVNLGSVRGFQQAVLPERNASTPLQPVSSSLPMHAHVQHEWSDAPLSQPVTTSQGGHASVQEPTAHPRASQQLGFQVQQGGSMAGMPGTLRLAPHMHYTCMHPSECSGSSPHQVRLKLPVQNADGRREAGARRSGSLISALTNNTQRIELCDGAQHMRLLQQSTQGMMPMMQMGGSPGGGGGHPMLVLLRCNDLRSQLGARPASSPVLGGAPSPGGVTSAGANSTFKIEADTGLSNGEAQGWHYTAIDRNMPPALSM